MVREGSDLEAGCLECLNYFSLFNFPLNSEEIWQFHPVQCTHEKIQDTLKKLLKSSEIIHFDSYYTLPGKAIANWVNERQKGFQRAVALLKRSRKHTRIIASFPFVESISISGSLSKFYASERPDVDYFIITAANRLWIARSLLHLFKKLTFITGHQHFYCMNYFVDLKALTISHPNLYSAIEVATLIPVYNKEVHTDFLLRNEWVRTYLPNHSGNEQTQYATGNGRHWLKKGIENVLNLLFPEQLNRSLMRLTDRKWRGKWQKKGYNMGEYDRAFHTTMHVSKNHPVDYEKKVLSLLTKPANP